MTLILRKQHGHRYLNTHGNTRKPRPKQVHEARADGFEQSLGEILKTLQELKVVKNAVVSTVGVGEVSDASTSPMRLEPSSVEVLNHDNQPPVLVPAAGATTLVEEPTAHQDGRITVTATSKQVTSSLGRTDETGEKNAVAPIVQAEKQHSLLDGAVVENQGSFSYHDLIKTALLFFCLGMVAGLLLLSETHSRLGCQTVCN